MTDERVQTHPKLLDCLLSELTICNDAIFMHKKVLGKYRFSLTLSTLLNDRLLDWTVRFAVRTNKYSALYL